MHVLAPSLISAQSVGLFALLLLGLGWRCRQGRARVACLALGGLCTAFWLQAPKDLRTQNRNHASLAFEILVHGRRLRFSGDADSKSMISEIQNEPSADVFELPHHGARCLDLETILKKRPPRLLLQSSSRRRAQKGPWKTWPGSPHLATGLHGGICIQIDSSGGMTAAAQNRFYTWPPEP